MLNIRPLAAHEWRAYRDIRPRALADAPDSFGSNWAEEQARPLEFWKTRLAAAAVSGKDYPLAAEQGGALVGLIWAKVNADDAAVVNIYQVWVAPESRGQGVAAALLREALAWARARETRAVQLDVTCGNAAAEQLYLRAGFQNIGAPVPFRPGTPLLEQTMRLELDAELQPVR